MKREPMNDNTWRDFLRILDTVPAGEAVSSNHLRGLMATADIPEKSRGGLFSQAVNQGYLKTVRYEASEGETAHRSPIRTYRRTKQQGQVAA